MAEPRAAEGRVFARFAAAAGLPAEGRADLAIDVTFPADPRWDRRSSMRLACGDGQDHPAGADPDAGKAALVAAHCDPAVREPFIAALTAASAAGLRRASRLAASEPGRG